MEFSAPQIVEKVGRFRVSHAFLNLLDLIFNVTVRNEEVRPAVVVVIEEKASKTQRDQAGAPHFRLWSFIHEQAIALVVIKRKHLVGKIGNDDAGVPERS